MKTHYLFAICLVILISSCVKNKKKGNCEFHRLEFVELKSNGGEVKDDKTILECLQIISKDDFILITNEAKTIHLKFSTSEGSIIEEFNMDLDGSVKKSFASIDEQEMELIEKNKTWEITIKSDNSSKFNGYIKLYKTSDGDYWKLDEENKDISAKN